MSAMYISQLQGFPLIAYATSVNINSLASTALTYANGLSSAGCLPLCGYVKYNTGTISLAVVRLDMGATALSGLVVLNGMTATKPVPFLASSLTGVLFDTSQALQITCATANGSASTADVYIFGIRT